MLFVDKPSDLSYDMFFEKYWFIISQKGDINKNYEYLDKMSEIWINYKFRNCFYLEDQVSDSNKKKIETLYRIYGSKVQR